MNKEERESMIEWLHTVTGMPRIKYERMDVDKLNKEYIEKVMARDG